MKEFTQNIVMIEPNRFDLDQIAWISEKFGIDKNLILDLKSKNISKIWIWKKTGKVLFYKESKNQHIKHEKIEFDMSNVQTFSLSGCYDPDSKSNLNVDTILDKISSSGIKSLNISEKEFLDKLKRVTKK